MLSQTPEQKIKDLTYLIEQDDVMIVNMDVTATKACPIEYDLFIYDIDDLLNGPWIPYVDSSFFKYIKSWNQLSGELAFSVDSQSGIIDLRVGAKIVVNDQNSNAIDI